MSQVKNRIPLGINSRSTKDLSVLNITTTDFGRIDHAASWECIPGDDITLNVSANFQNSPMPTNTFGRFWFDIRAFFVPYRIMCAERFREDNFSWDNFITGLNAITHPYTTLDFVNQCLYGHALGDNNNIDLKYRKDLRRHLSKMRIPKYYYNEDIYEGQEEEVISTGAANGERLNLWKLSAYQHIWWTYYRDSQLIDERLYHTYVPFLQAGSQNTNFARLLQPRYCCFKKDYFTLARTMPQSGNPSATTTAPITGYESIVQAEKFNPNNVLSTTGVRQQDGDLIPATWVRAALSLQKYLERNNLVGTRAMARFLARFGVAPSYERLNLPEYIGGYRKLCIVGDIMQTTSTGNAVAQPFESFEGVSEAGARIGNLGISSGMDTIKYHATEFGVLMVVHTLVPEVMYTQGLEKEWTRGTNNDKFDYFTPELQDVGDQAIRLAELWMDGNETTATRNLIFGWTRRYEDYCYKPDIVSGDVMLKETSTGMDNIHLARLFDDQPSLTPEFTMIGPSQRLQFDRIFSIVGDESEFDHFKGYVNCRCSMTRNMSGAPAPELEEDAKAHVVVPNGGVRF